MRIYLLDMSDGFKETETIVKTVGLGAYSVAAIDLADKIGAHTLIVADTECDGNVYRSYFKKGKLEIQRQDAFTVLAKSENEITIRADAYIQALELEGDYNFSDNYFTMLRGEIKTVSYEKFSDKACGITVKSYTLL